MAVLALGLIGTAIGGSIGGTVLGMTAASLGGFIGSTLGGLVDNMLFGANKVEGPRLNDRRVMGSSYGKTIPRLYGPENRLACEVIWSSGLIETKHKEGGKGGMLGPTVISYTYSISAAFLAGDGRASGLSALKKIWANGKLIYDADGSGSPPVEKVVFGSVQFYAGNGTQLPDPTIESYKGVGNAPAYRHSCYFVLTDLELADFGNRLPNIEALIEADESINVQGVVEDIMQASGVDLNALSTTGLPPDLVRGYIIGGQSRGVDALQPLALIYGFDAAEQGGNFRFVRRGGAAMGVISYDDVGALEGQQSGDPPEPVRFGLMSTVGLPKEAVVTFSDPARDYQPNSQPSRRQFGDPESNLSHEVPIVLDADTGRRTADRMLFEGETSRRTIAFEGNERFRDIWPGDVWLIESPGGYTRTRITRLLRGANRVYQFEGREDDPEIYNSQARAVRADLPPQVIEAVGDTILALLDIPILRDADDDTGFYVAGAGEFSGWRGGYLYRAPDNVTYVEEMPIVRSAVLGTCPTVPDGQAEMWDRLSVITVRLDRADLALESMSESAVLAGQNGAWIGDLDDSRLGEIIQFATATLVAPGVYELTDLLRGRLGTESAMATHGVDDRFVLLDGAIQRLDTGASEWNKRRRFKGVSLWQAEADAAVYPFENTGEGKQPLSPVHPHGLRNDAGDLTISWVRRSRLRAPGLGNGATPLGETVEEYRVDVLPPGSTPYDAVSATRNIIVLGPPTVVYTAAQQIADGYAPGDPIPMRISQISDIHGRGNVCYALL